MLSVLATLSLSLRAFELRRWPCREPGRCWSARWVVATAQLPCLGCKYDEVHVASAQVLVRFLDTVTELGQQKALRRLARWHAQILAVSATSLLEQLCLH